MPEGLRRVSKNIFEGLIRTNKEVQTSGWRNFVVPPSVSHQFSRLTTRSRVKFRSQELCLLVTKSGRVMLTFLTAHVGTFKQLLFFDLNRFVSEKCEQPRMGTFHESDLPTFTWNGDCSILLRASWLALFSARQQAISCSLPSLVEGASL
jgi:hypothetical protein